MTPFEGILKQLEETSKDLEKKIQKLSQMDHIFGIISSKYICCGKSNCKCAKGKKYYHGPYYYLRLEPDYKYKEYLGKKIPFEIKEKINIGKELKEAIRKKNKIDNTLKKLSFLNG